VSVREGLRQDTAIGYHDGTKDDLLTTALSEWGDDLGKALAAATHPEALPAERFAATWTQVVRSFGENHRLWAVQFELLAFLEQKPELRAAFAETDQQARLGLAELFDRPGDEPVGAVYQALIGGLTSQWLVDPESTPTGAELRAAVVGIAAGIA
jgi:AcrR family transcriptional regulator